MIVYKIPHICKAVGACNLTVQDQKEKEKREKKGIENEIEQPKKSKTNKEWMSKGYLDNQNNKKKKKLYQNVTMKKRMKRRRKNKQILTVITQTSVGHAIVIQSCRISMEYHKHNIYIYISKYMCMLEYRRAEIKDLRIDGWGNRKKLFTNNFDCKD